MKAVITAKRISKDGRIIGEIKQPSRSFLRGVMEQLYILGAQSAGRAIPKIAIYSNYRQSAGLEPHESNLQICGRGSSPGINAPVGESIFPVSTSCLGIVIGKDDTAVSSGDFRLGDIAIPVGNGAIETMTDITDAGWKAQTPIAWDATLGVFWTLDANLTPWVLSKWSKAGVLQGTRTVTGTAATTSTQYGLAADATHVFISGGASSRYIYKVSKADGSNINVNAYTVMGSQTPLGVTIDGAFVWTYSTAKFLKLNIADLSTAGGPWAVTGIAGGRGDINVWKGYLVLGGGGTAFTFFTKTDPPVLVGSTRILTGSGSVIAMYGFAAEDDSHMWIHAIQTYPAPAMTGLFRMFWPGTTDTVQSEGTSCRMTAVDAAHGEMTIFADFYNAGSASVDIKEVGIYSLAPTEGLICIARDVLGATVTVAAGETMRVEYLVECFV